ncbi:MAG: hypothetical protein AAGF23_12760 [Acidobacteriota bacterium]
MSRQDPPSIRRERLRKIHQVVLGCAVGLLFILGVEAILAIDRGAEVRLFDISSSDRWSMVLSDGRDRVKIKSRGDVEVLEDGPIPSLDIAEGGVLRIDARLDGERRRLEARGTVDGVTYDYRVDGDRRDLGEEGRRWLGDILIEALRDGGIQAKERAIRIFEEGGPDALDVELALISSEETRGRYLIAALDTDPPAADLATLIALAQRRLDGDYPLISILSSVSPPALRDGAVAEAYFAAVRSLGADHAKGRLLSHAVEADLGDRWPSFFRAADAIHSDHEAASLVVEYAGLGRTDAPEGLLRFVKGIESDHLQRRAVEALFQSPLDPAGRDALLAAAADDLSSDHEATRLLVFHAGAGGGVSPGALALLRTIDSDHDQGRAAGALAETAAAEDLATVVRALSIESDHVLAQMLLELRGRAGDGGPELRRAVEAAAAGLDDDNARRRVDGAWGLDGRSAEP